MGNRLRQTSRLLGGFFICGSGQTRYQGVVRRKQF